MRSKLLVLTAFTLIFGFVMAKQLNLVSSVVKSALAASDSVTTPSPSATPSTSTVFNFTVEPISAYVNQSVALTYSYTSITNEPVTARTTLPNGLVVENEPGYSNNCQTGMWGCTFDVTFPAGVTTVTKHIHALFPSVNYSDGYGIMTGFSEPSTGFTKIFTYFLIVDVAPTPTPSPTIIPTPTPTPSPVPTIVPTPSPVPSPSNNFNVVLLNNNAYVNGKVFINWVWNMLGNPATSVTFTTTFPSGVKANINDACRSGNGCSYTYTFYKGNTAGISMGTDITSSQAGIYNISTIYSEVGGNSGSYNSKLTILNFPSPTPSPVPTPTPTPSPRPTPTPFPTPIPLYSVRGTITKGAGFLAVPVANVKVFVIKNGVKIAQMYTNANGVFKIGLVSGNYRIKPDPASGYSFSPKYRDITVVNQAVTGVDFKVLLNVFTTDSL